LADITSHWFAFTSLMPGIPLVLAAQIFRAIAAMPTRWTLALIARIEMVHNKEWYPFHLESRRNLNNNKRES
jgi:hypothetical protein